MNCKISVIIPCYCTNNRHDWGRLYLSLLGYANQSLPKNLYEIIVIDDGSEWNITEHVNSWKLPIPIKIIRQEHTGMCSAYQTGINYANGEYIFLGIDDNIPCAILLEEHLKELESNNNVVVWGREYHMRKMKKIFNPISGYINNLSNNDLLANEETNTDKININDIFSNFNILIDNSILTEKYSDIEMFIENCQSLKQTSAAWLIMRVGNQSLSRKLLDKVGGIDRGFDPSGWYMDLELGLRLIKEGADFKLNTKAVMIHLSHEREKIALQDESLKHKYFYSKHPLIEVALAPIFFKSNLKIYEFSNYIDRIKGFYPKGL